MIRSFSGCVALAQLTANLWRRLSFALVDQHWSSEDHMKAGGSLPSGLQPCWLRPSRRRRQRPMALQIKNRSSCHLSRCGPRVRSLLQRLPRAQAAASPPGTWRMTTNPSGSVPRSGGVIIRDARRALARGSAWSSQCNVHGFGPRSRSTPRRRPFASELGGVQHSFRRKLADPLCRTCQGRDCRDDLACRHQWSRFASASTTTLPER
jgi:hypothetical protein